MRNGWQRQPADRISNQPGAGVRMEQQARELAERDAIREGSICIFAKVEPCRSFSFKYSQGDAYVNSATRKCLHL
jgi:hypothetical protein